MSALHIATWNVNSLRSRLERVKAWIERKNPTVLCLQETKCPDESFPREEFEAMGFHVAYAGQTNGLNGVAILSREPIMDVLAVLPGTDHDDQRRFLSLETCGVRVIDVYVPNGQSLGSDAFFYKMDWLTRLLSHLRKTHSPEEPLVLLGDFNIAPDDRDVHDPAAWEGRTHVSALERGSLGYLQAWGLEDVYRRLHDDGGRFSWFDYRDTFKGFSTDRGLRIDLIYATATLAARVESVEIDLDERADSCDSTPSDHAPVLASFGPP